MKREKAKGGSMGNVKKMSQKKISKLQAKDKCPKVGFSKNLLKPPPFHAYTYSNKDQKKMFGKSSKR